MYTVYACRFSYFVFIFGGCITKIHILNTICPLTKQYISNFFSSLSYEYSSEFSLWFLVARTKTKQKKNCLLSVYSNSKFIHVHMIFFFCSHRSSNSKYFYVRFCCRCLLNNQILILVYVFSFNHFNLMCIHILLVQ